MDFNERMNLLLAVAGIAGIVLVVLASGFRPW